MNNRQRKLVLKCNYCGITWQEEQVDYKCNHCGNHPLIPGYITVSSGVDGYKDESKDYRQDYYDGDPQLESEEEKDKEEILKDMPNPDYYDDYGDYS